VTRLRYALITVSAVLFAFALGIALGGGPLQGPIRTSLQSQVEAVTSPDTERSAALLRHNQALARSLRFDQAFTQAVAPDLLDDRLTGRSVVVLSLPGVAPTVTDGVVADLRTAGGQVTSALRVGHQLVDPTARPLVAALSRRLLPGLDSVEVPEGTSVYTRVGAVAARALLTPDDGGAAMDEQARSVLSTFRTAGLLHGSAPRERADTAVVLVPDAPRSAGSSASSAGRSTVMTELTAALDQAADGVVVAGPPSAAQPGGVLAALRNAPLTADAVSTVDTASVSAGRLVTALALAEQVDGGTGHYGIGPGADARLPAALLAP
jgi:Copper transport outer membrane protein, MctB